MYVCTYYFLYVRILISVYVCMLIFLGVFFSPNFFVTWRYYLLLTIRNLKCLRLTYNGQQSLPRHTVASFLEGQRPASKFHAYLLNTCMCGLFAPPPPPKPVFCFFNSVMLAHEHPQEDLATFGYRSAMIVEI